MNVEFLTKAEFIKEMQDYSDTNLTAAKCKDAYECVCAVIRDSIVQNGKGIRLEGIGSIVPVVKEAREMEDKLHGKGTIKIPRHLSCRFKIAESFKNKMTDAKIPSNLK